MEFPTTLFHRVSVGIQPIEGTFQATQTMGNSIPNKFTQSDWDSLAQRFPAGTTVIGTVTDCPIYGVWITLDGLPDVPALLEVIHFAILNTEPKHPIHHPDDYPRIGSRLEARILGWCATPKDVRVTQLSHLGWSQGEHLRKIADQQDPTLPQ